MHDQLRAQALMWVALVLIFPQAFLSDDWWAFVLMLAGGVFAVAGLVVMLRSLSANRNAKPS